MSSIDDMTLSTLDDIAVPSTSDSQRVAFRIGLICTLFARDGGRPEQRRQLAQCGEDYIADFGRHLKAHLPPSGAGGYRKLAAESHMLLDYVTEYPSSATPFTPVFSGSDNIRDASSYSMELTSTRTPQGKELCCFSATLPFQYILERPHEGAFQKLVAKWCSILKPHSGYAGLGIIQSADYDERLRTSAQAFAFGSRFPCLEVDNPSLIALYIDDHVKGVNWLTILGNGCLAKMGKSDSLEGLTTETTRRLCYEGGVILQLGAAPQIGDANRQNLPADYVQMSKSLKPYRMKFPDGRSFIRGVPGKTGTEASNQWLARFD